jgi:hypothetical protein
MLCLRKIQGCWFSFTPFTMVKSPINPNPVASQLSWRHRTSIFVDGFPHCHHPSGLPTMNSNRKSWIATFMMVYWYTLWEFNGSLLKMAHRNSWFTSKWWILHSKLIVYQRVIPSPPNMKQPLRHHGLGGNFMEFPHFFGTIQWWCFSCSGWDFYIFHILAITLYCIIWPSFATSFLISLDWGILEI